MKQIREQQESFPVITGVRSLVDFQVKLEKESDSDEDICPEFEIDEDYEISFPVKEEFDDEISVEELGAQDSRVTFQKRTKLTAENGRFKCDQIDCQREFSTIYTLQNHVRIVHEKMALFRCYFCDEDLASRTALFQHTMGQHLKELPYFCVSKTCRFKTANKSYWMTHIKESHPKDWKTIKEQNKKPSEYKCEQCSKSFPHRENRRRHMQTHLKRKIYSCKFCEKSYLKPASLKEHQIAEHGKSGPSFSCPYEDCNRPPFPSKARLNSHIKITHIQDEVKCEHCSATFKNKICLRDHKTRSKMCAKLSGRNLRLHECPHPGCKKSFVEKGSLNVHVAAVHDPAKKKLGQKCKLCEAAFQWRRQLGKHMAAEHGGIPCDMCDKKLENHNSLAAHRKRVHLVGVEKKEFKCEFKGCGRLFLFNYELENHKKILHEKQKLFSCYFCERKFSNKIFLHQHMMGQHLRERPWSCEVKGCEFSTSMKGHWQVHMRETHSKG